MESTTTPNIEELWRDFHGELLAFARPRLASESAAEDILQDTFLRAHRQLASGTTPTNPRGWLYQIVRNLVIDTHRLEARRREVPQPPDLEDLSDRSAPELEEEAHTVVARCLPIFIAKLRSPYREALQQTEIEGLTQAEAAARSGVSLSGMKSRVQRARGQLLASLRRCCEFGLDARNRVIEFRRHQPREEC